MRVETVYLVLRSDGTAKALRRLNSLSNNEVCVRVRVSWPDGWGRTIDTVEVEMPNAPTVDFEPEDPSSSS